jgi:hypothetical protein
MTETRDRKEAKLLLAKNFVKKLRTSIPRRRIKREKSTSRKTRPTRNSERKQLKALIEKWKTTG